MPIRLPGLVNAHVHLEWPARETPQGVGLPAWVKALRGGAPPTLEAASRNARDAYHAGTAYVVDIGNTEAGAQALARERPATAPSPRSVPFGIALREIVGIDVMALPEDAGVVPYTPHSTYAANAAVIRACALAVVAQGRPLSIHCDEDPDERAYLRDATGEFADWARALGRDMSRFEAPGCTPIQYLDRLGALGPRTLLVHCTISDPADLALVAGRGASIVLCPASNLHITDRLPDVQSMIQAGVRLLIGSDSLASCPTVDLLHQATLLRAAFPSISSQTWVDALTGNAAHVLGLSSATLGQLEFAAPSVDALFDGTDWERRWISPPAGP